MTKTHFTHHLCLAHGEMPSRVVDGERRTYSDYRDHQRLFGNGTPVPDVGWCRFARGRGKRVRYTVNREEVTCSSCKAPASHAWEPLEAIKAQAASIAIDSRHFDQRIRDWVPEAEVTARAWLLCCRHAGVPAPFSAAELLRRERQLRALQASQAISSALPMLFLRASAQQSIEAALRERVAQLDPVDQMLMARVIERARAADVMLGDIERELAAIQDDSVRVATRIRSCALVAVPA